MVHQAQQGAPCACLFGALRACYAKKQKKLKLGVDNSKKV